MLSLAFALLTTPVFAAEDAPLKVAPDGLKLISRVEPRFPDALKGANDGEGAEYVCTVDVVVERSGIPSQATVVPDPACPPVAGAAAQTSLMQWRWEPPTLLTGEVVRAQTQLRIRFRETPNTGISGQRIGVDSLQVLLSAHAVQPDGFPTCNLRVGVDRDGHVLQRRTNQAACLVRADAQQVAPSGVSQGMACLFTFESDGGTATAIKVVQCPKAARSWMKQLVSSWEWLAPAGTRQGYMAQVEVVR